MVTELQPPVFDAVRARLYAEITFPAQCAWCIEAGENDPAIESREQLGGFCGDSGVPVCTDCMNAVCDEMHS